MILEAWRIDGSRPAPHLRVELEPDEWSRSVRDSRTSGLSHNEALCPEYWAETQRTLQQRDTRWETGRKPSKKPWMVFASNNHVGYHATFYDRRPKRRLRAEVFIEAPDTARTALIYDELNSRRAVIEEQLGYGLDWESEAIRKSARISISYGAFVSEDATAAWPEAQRWLVQALCELRNIFDPVLEGMTQ